MRTAQVTRRTAETDIRLSLTLDGRGTVKTDTGVGFLNHMLELFARHARFDLDVVCRGDTGVDDHHSVEDIGIVLGEAIVRAVGEKRGKIGTFDTELVKEFFLALTRASGMTLHIRLLDGENAHHIAEAMFKGFGRALAEAVSVDERLNGEIPSTKGVLV